MKVFALFCASRTWQHYIISSGMFWVDSHLIVFMMYCFDLLESSSSNESAVIFIAGFCLHWAKWIFITILSLFWLAALWNILIASAYFYCASKPNPLAAKSMFEVLLLSSAELNKSVYYCGFVSLYTWPLVESTNFISLLAFVI